MPDPPQSHDFVYVHTDIPPGLTIREWRAERAARAARLRDAQRRARRGRALAVFTQLVRRLVGDVAPHAAVRVRSLRSACIELQGYPCIY
jgi:hypothetical protein